MKTYQLIDSGGFRKLEQLGEFKIVRPSASAVWNTHLSTKEWSRVDAEFVRHSDGTGEWKVHDQRIEEPFEIEIDEIRFQMKLTSFGHLGLFPEQKRHWAYLEKWVADQKRHNQEVRVLNLFAYTGGSTLFCARGGAEVTHVDASKGTVRWAADNAKASGLEDKKIRWIVDDVKEFVGREIRRGSRYHAVILDPPSYGKGEKRQVWKIEKDLMPLLEQIKQIMIGEGERLVCLSAHSEGYSPISLRNQLLSVYGKGLEIDAAEMVIPDSFDRPLPSGAGAIWRGHLELK